MAAGRSLSGMRRTVRVIICGDWQFSGGCVERAAVQPCAELTEQLDKLLLALRGENVNAQQDGVFGKLKFDRKARCFAGQPERPIFGDLRAKHSDRILHGREIEKIRRIFARLQRRNAGGLLFTRRSSFG